MLIEGDTAISVKGVIIKEMTTEIKKNYFSLHYACEVSEMSDDSEGHKAI